MKLTILSLVIFGYAAFCRAETAWQKNTRYVYQLDIAIASAIPELRSDFSGLGFRGKLVIEVGQADRRLVCQIKNAEMGHDDDDHPPVSSPDSWKNYVKLEWTPMPEKANKQISQPFVLEFADGEVKSIETQVDEETWSVNIKKGIASQLAINVQGTNRIPMFSNEEHESKLRTNRFRATGQEDESKEFFAVEEDSVGGRCKTVYTISPLPEYVAQAQEQHVPQELRAYYKERPGGGEPSYIVTKVRDYSNCQRKSFFYADSFMDNSPDSCNPSFNQCKHFTTRTSITRYLIRGQLDDFRVEKLWAQGEFIIRPWGADTEKFYTITNQTLTLLEMDPSSKFQMPTSMRLGRKETLDFRFPEKTQGKSSESLEPIFSPIHNSQSISQSSQRSRGGVSNPDRPLGRQEMSDTASSLEMEKDEKDPYEDSKGLHNYDSVMSYIPKESERELWRTSVLRGDRRGQQGSPYVFPNTNFRKLKKIEARPIMQQVEIMLTEVSRHLRDNEDLANKETPLRVLEIARAMTILGKEELIEVYNVAISGSADAATEEIRKQVILDALVMAGTEPAIIFVKELIEKGEAKDEQAIQLVSTIPSSVKAMSLNVLKQLMNLVEKKASDPEILENDYYKRQLWITTLLALTRLVHQACIDPKTKISNYPGTGENAETCSENNGFVTQRILPYLEQGLQSSQDKWKKSVILQALSNMGHPHILKIVRPYIHVSGRNPPSTDIHVRVKAIYALNRVADIYPSLIFTELKPVYNNFNDHYEVRMSAFSVLVKCNPPATFWQEAATLTWFEPSQQVASLVYSQIASLANATLPRYYNASMEARMALPLAKPLNLGMHYSHSYMFQSYVPEKQMGSDMTLAWFGSEESIVPRAVYFKSGIEAGGFANDFVEISAHGKGIQGVINNFFIRYFHQKEEHFSSFWDKVKEGPFKKVIPIQDIHNILGIEPRGHEPMQGSFSVKFSSQIERYFTFDEKTIRRIINEIVIGGSTIMGSGFTREYPINWHKTMSLPSIYTMLPTEAGIPIFYNMKRPLLVSVTGKIKVQVTPSKTSMIPNIKIESNLNPRIVVNNLMESGVICPVTNEIFAVGLEWHASRSMPHSIEAEIDMHEKQLKIEAKPYEGKLPEKVRFVHIHQRPFTTRKPLLDFTVTPLAKSTEIILTEPVEIENKTRFGGDIFGFPLEFHSKWDAPFYDWAGLYNLYNTYGLSSPHLIQAPHTMRNFEYSLEVPTSQISIQKAELTLEYFETDKKCGIFGAACDKLVGERYYRNSEVRNDWTQFFTDSHVRLQKFLHEPMSAFTKCKDKDSQCYEIYTNKLTEATPTFRQQHDYLKYMDEEDKARVSTGNVKGAHVTLALYPKSQPPKISKTTIHYTRATEGVEQKLTIQGELNPLSSRDSTPYQFYASGRIQYSRMQPTQNRRAMLHNSQSAKAHVEVRFGPSLRSSVTADIAMTRSAEQKRFAENSQSSQVCQRDESQGQMYSPACLKARSLATTVNKYAINIKTEQAPEWLMNVSYQADDMLKYALYPYISNNRLNVQNAGGSVMVVLDVKPPQPAHPYSVLDAYVYKPWENSFFNNMKVPVVLDGFFPLSTKLSLGEIVEKKIFMDQFIPMCKLEKGTVRTFDNVTYHYSMGDCYHVIAKDCSENFKVAILAKEERNGKSVKIHVEDQTVEIKPASGVEASTTSQIPLIVEVNGEEVKLSPTEKKVLGGPGAELQVKLRRDLEVEVRAPAHGLRVITSGHRFKVQMSNLYRGLTCGLCGDMNGEKFGEFKSPSKCIFNNPEFFARSYALVTGSCHLPRALQPVSEATSKCIKQQSIRPLGMPHGYNSEDMETSTVPTSLQTCTTYATKVVKHGDKLCFSVKPLAECSLDCKPSELITKKVGFHCLPDNQNTMRLMTKARYGVVESMLNKPVHVMHHVSVPESCERIRN